MTTASFQFQINSLYTYTCIINNVRKVKKINYNYYIIFLENTFESKKCGKINLILDLINTYKTQVNTDMCTSSTHLYKQQIGKKCSLNSKCDQHMEITQNDDIHNKIIIFSISLKCQIELSVEQEKKIQSLYSNYIKVQF